MKNFYYSLADLGRPFFLLWMGETVSLLGTMLMEFALGVWIYQKTGSVLDFSGIIIAATLPALLVLPLAGSIADKVDRRYVLITCDLVMAIATLSLAYLLWHVHMEIAYLYIFNAIGSIANAFRMPAYQAAIASLLSREKLNSASGMMGLSTNLLSMVAPLAAGSIMGLGGLPVVVFADLIALGMGSLLVLRAFYLLRRIKLSPQSIQQDDLEEASGFGSALGFFKREPLMLGLLFYAVVQAALITLTSTMITPLVLANHTTEELGLILTCGSVGGLLGAGLLMVMGNKLKRIMISVFLSDALLAACVMIAGIQTSLWFYCICAFVALFAAGFADGCGHALWMRKVPQQNQGSIFALVGTLALVTASFIVLSGGFVADTWFEPALATGGAWQETIGYWLGTGKGRGVGFMFVVVGSLGVLLSLSAFAHSRLRRLDQLVPDVLGVTEQS